MARDVESLVLSMSADIRRLEKNLNQGQRSFDKTADAIERRQRTLDKNLANLGREAGNFARPVQVAATVALGAITAFSYSAARRAEAVNGAFTQTFRDMPQQAAAATAAISEDFNRLETDIKDNFTQLRSVLTALGVDAAQSIKIVDQLQRRSLDIAAFKDVSDAQAFQAVISGITGETEPLKRFGIVVNETATKAELLRLGFKGNATEASEAAKSIARTNIILRQSADMHGQVARESNTLAEQEKRTRAEFTKAAEDFGKQFLPVAKEVLKWATDALKAFTDLPSGTQAAGLGLLALVAASGPIAAVVGGLQTLIKAAVAARVALAAVAGSAAAGGVAGRAAAAGGAAAAAARFGAPAAVGASVLSLSGDSRQAPLQGQERINNQLAEERRLRGEIQRLQRQGDAEEAARQQAYLGRVQANRRAAQQAAVTPAQRQAEEAAKAIKEADDAAKTALAGLGDFSLSQGQLTPTGPAKADASARAAARKAAADAKRIAELREQLALEVAIDVARASGDEAAVKAAEERQTLARLTAEYEAAGYKNARAQAIERLSLINAAEAAAEAREKAEKEVEIILEGRRRQLQRDADFAERQNDLIADELGYRLQIASLRGDLSQIALLEREEFIHRRINELLAMRPELTEAAGRQIATQEAGELYAAGRDGEMRDQFRSAFSDGIKAAIDGDLGGFFESMADRFTSRMLDNLADDLFDLLSEAAKGFGGSGRAGGGIASFIGSLFGKRATGGPVMAGQPYITGERRAEVFVPNVNGTIIPSVNAAMNKASQGRGSNVVEFRQTINLEGANGDQAIRKIAYEAAAEGGRAAYAQASADIPANIAKRQRYSR